MAKIRILNDQVVNQIAAGEVVERPASVVKELVENSLDAGATEVTVSITNGGRTGIEVLDNGCGMTKDDALLAIERFGTSKISSVADLESIATHGFRGEALPSIASVSKFRLSTAVRDAAAGVVIYIEGGAVREVADSSLAPGTKIEVRQLFFNVPARRKFLRSETTEAGIIKALLIDFALAYPTVRFRLVIDGLESASYSPGADFEQRAGALRLAGERPICCRSEMQVASGEIRVSAALSQPVECVVNSGRLRLLINRRSVRDKLMLKAVRDGYGNFLRPGRYPIGVLALEMPPSEVDVNVHPQKTEVRFRRPELMFSAVTGAISSALKKEQFVYSAPERSSDFDYGSVGERSVDVGSTGADGSADIRRVTAESLFAPSAFRTAAPEQSSFAELRPEAPLVTGNVSVSAAPVFRAKPPALDNMRFVGQVFGCYLIFAGEGSVAMVDMHAAHERVMFYRIKSQLRGGGVHSQLLLIPEKITLPPDRAEQFEAFQGALATLGIEADRLSETTIVVRALPALLRDVSASAIFAELFALPEWSDWGALVSNAWDMAIARLACHRSVRKGRELEPKEAYELMQALSEAEASGFCPHGRPIVKFLSEADFENMFGRDA